MKTKVALHIVGVLRNFRLIIPSVQNLVDELTDFDVTIFLTVWDKSPLKNGIIENFKLAKDENLVDVCLDDLKQLMIESFPNNHTIVKVYPYDPTLHRSKSFFKIIYLSYLDRLKEELRISNIFEKVILTRTDVVFLARQDEVFKFKKCLGADTVNQLNFIGKYSDNSGFFPTGPDHLHEICHGAYDLVFYGSFREMNLLMRSFNHLHLLGDLEIDNHIVFGSVLKRHGIFLSNQFYSLHPVIVRTLDGISLPELTRDK